MVIERGMIVDAVMENIYYAGDDFLQQSWYFG